MANDGKTYLTFMGVVQFDPKDRSTSNGDLREVAIRLCNHAEGRIVNVALWENSFSDLKISKGDAVIVDGTFTSRVHEKDDGTSATYYNVTATRVAVIPTVSGSKADSGQERKVSNKKTDDAPAF